jgi:xylulokinase
MCLDRRTGSWWPEILGAVGLDERLLPSIRPSGARIGAVNERAARELGLPVGTPVANGAADRAAEALATGVEGGEAMVSMGTATGIVCSIPEAERSTDSAVLTPRHAVPGRSMALLSVTTSGAAFAWLMSILGADGSDEGWARLMGEAAASPPGSRGVTFLPFLAGAKSVRWAAGATGVVAGLALSAGRGDLVRAALEGIAFETAACLGRLAAMRPVERTILVGGGHRDDLAARILVDVTGIAALRLPEPHAGAMGAMLLAGQAIGLWADPLALARERRQGTELVPDPAHHAAYAAARERYDALCVTVGLPPVDP